MGEWKGEYFDFGRPWPPARSGTILRLGEKRPRREGGIKKEGSTGEGETGGVGREGGLGIGNAGTRRLGEREDGESERMGDGRMGRDGDEANYRNA